MRKQAARVIATVERGTGLGLPICERIMREHDGEMEIESIPGEGTRFTLRLPLDQLPRDDEDNEEDEEEVPTLATL